MKQYFLPWWRQRSRRERHMLGVMLLLLAAAAIWLAVLRPLGTALDRARARHALAVADLVASRQLAADIGRLPRRAAPTRPINVILAEAAEAEGFTPARLEPRGGAYLLAIDAARPQAVFPWLDRLVREQGLVLRELDARANADQSIAVRALFDAAGAR